MADPGYDGRGEHYSDDLLSAARALNNEEQTHGHFSPAAANGAGYEPTHSDSSLIFVDLNGDDTAIEPNAHFTGPDQSFEMHQRSVHDPQNPVYTRHSGDFNRYEDSHAYQGDGQQVENAGDQFKSSRVDATHTEAHEAWGVPPPDENLAPAVKKKKSKKKQKQKLHQLAELEIYGAGQEYMETQAYPEASLGHHNEPEQFEHDANPPHSFGHPHGQYEPTRYDDNAALQYKHRPYSHNQVQTATERKGGGRNGMVYGLSRGLGFQPRRTFTPYRPKHVATQRKAMSVVAKQPFKNHANQQHDGQQINPSTFGVHQTMEHLMTHFQNIDGERLRSEADRQAANDELQHALSDKRALEDQLRVIEQEKDGLSADIDKHKATYCSKFTRLKTFVDGLGHDHSSLKRELSSHLQKHEQLVEEMDALRDTRDTLLLELQACNEQSVQLRNQAMDGFKDSQTEVANATLRISQLEQQLNDKAKLLADEKDLRTQLQGQLNNTSSSREAVVREMKSSHEAILDKLFEMHAAVEEYETGHDMTEKLEKLASAIQSLNSEQVGAANNVTSVKELIEELSETFDNVSSTVTSQFENRQESSIKPHLDEALKNLKADVIQEQHNREKISQLEQQVERISELDMQLKAAQASETQLKEQIVALQASVPDEDAGSRLSELSEELQTLQAALTSAKTELVGKNNEIRELSDAKADVDQEVGSLQKQLEEMKAASSPEVIENVRKEMSKQAAEHRATQKAGFDNEKKKLTAERDRLTTKVKQMETELAGCIGELEKYRPEQSGVSSRMLELKELRTLADQQGTTIQALQSSLHELQGEKAKSEEENDALKARNVAQERKLQDANQDNTTLNHRIDELGRQAESACAGEQRTKSDIDELNRQLKAAKDGAHQLSSSFQTILDEDKRKADQRVEDLQQSLADCQSQLQRKQDEHEKFLSDVQASWNSEQKKHKETLAALRNKIAEAEAARDEANANNEQLRAELGKGQPGDVTDLANSRHGTVSAQSQNPEQELDDRRPPGLAAPARDEMEKGNAGISPVVEESQPTFEAQRKGPIVDESQDVYTHYGNSLPSSSPLTVSNDHPKRRIEVPATQEELESPSHQRPKDTVAADAVPKTQPQTAATRPATFAQFKASRIAMLEPEFEVFVDYSQDVYTLTKSNDGSRAPLQQHSEAIDYQFKKPMPPPNSSQKLVRANSVSQRPKQPSALSKRPQMSSRYQTPEPLTLSEGNGNRTDSSQRSPMQSSSPEFITTASMKRTLTTYQGHASAGERINPRKSSEDLNEARPAPPKRKADSQIIDDYEAARKKHSNVTKADATTRGRSGLRSLSQLSVPAQLGLPSSQPAQTPASRMRSSAGTTSRQTRGTRKMSKNDEIDARFAQELDGY